MSDQDSADTQYPESHGRGPEQTGDESERGDASLHALASEDSPVMTDAKGSAGLDADEEPQGPDADYWEDPSSTAPGSPGRPLGSSPREQRS
jgi:hypothetical protein